MNQSLESLDTRYKASIGCVPGESRDCCRGRDSEEASRQLGHCPHLSPRRRDAWARAASAAAHALRPPSPRTRAVAMGPDEDPRSPAPPVTPVATQAVAAAGAGSGRQAVAALQCRPAGGAVSGGGRPPDPYRRQELGLRPKHCVGGQAPGEVGGGVGLGVGSKGGETDPARTWTVPVMSVPRPPVHDATPSVAVRLCGGGGAARERARCPPVTRAWGRARVPTRARAPSESRARERTKMEGARERERERERARERAAASARRRASGVPYTSGGPHAARGAGRDGQRCGTGAGRPWVCRTEFCQAPTELSQDPTELSQAPTERSQDVSRGRSSPSSVPPDTWRYTKIHEDTRRYTEIHGDTRRYTEIHGGTRRRHARSVCGHGELAGAIRVYP